jgi:hypothetical protein
VAARKPKSPHAINLPTVYDANTHRLTEDYKRAVKEALPTGVNPPNNFWRDLTMMVIAYLASEQNRASRRPPAGEIKRWEKIAKAAAMEGRPHAALAVVKRIAESQLAAYQALPDFSRKKNPYREGLYIMIFDLWCRGLGQNLGVSGEGNPVPGPLLKFFGACVNPLLPKPLKPTGISSARDRENNRRERHAITRDKNQP